jgi:hypothetical protein
MDIQVKVMPNSKKPEVIKISGSAYRVRVDAPASENKANKRLVEILSEHFSVPKSSIKILKGFKSKDKIIKIEV